MPTTAAFSWLLFIVNPCIPINLIYYTHSKCLTTGNTSTFDTTVCQNIIKLISATFSTGIFLFTFGNCVLEYVLFTVLHCNCFINFIALIQEKLQHDKASTLDILARKWFEIELLIRAYNEIHAGVLSGCTTALLSFVAIISLYSSLAFSTITPELCMFLLLVVDTSLLTVEGDGHFKGQVYVKSRKLLNDLKRSLKYFKTKAARRYGSTMHCFKISLGSGNYYDQLVALSLLHFNVTQTVTLLLL